MTNKFSDIINSDTPTLVDFFAEWCGPCKAMQPYIKAVKQAMGDKLIILKIDIDKNAKASAAYQIQSVPTLVLFKKGQIKWRQSGLLNTKQILQALQQHV